MYEVFLSGSDYLHAIGSVLGIALAAVCFLIYIVDRSDRTWRSLGLFGAATAFCSFLVFLSFIIDSSFVSAVLIPALHMAGIIMLCDFSLKRSGYSYIKKIDRFFLPSALFIIVLSGAAGRLSGAFYAVCAISAGAGVIISFFRISRISKRFFSGVSFFSLGLDLASGLFLIVSSLMFLFFKDSFVQGRPFGLYLIGPAAGWVRLVFIAIFFVSAMVLWRSSKAEGKERIPGIAGTAISAACILFIYCLLGFFAVSLAGKMYRQQSESGFLIGAALGSVSLHAETIEKLSGSPADEKTDEFKELQGHLLSVKNADDKISFAYLMGLRNGNVVFLADALPASDPDYSPPGQIYHEVTPELMNKFRGAKASVSGPSTDRWGTWISALVPIKYPVTGEVAGVFGVDIDSGRFFHDLLVRRFPVINVIQLILLAVCGLFIYREFVRISLDKIKLTEANFRTIFDKAPEGIVIYEASSGKIAAVNSFFANLIGYQRNVFTRTYIREIAGWSREEFLEHVDSVMQGQISCIPEAKFRQRGGALIDVEITASPLVFRESDCIIAFIRDISEKKKIESSLSQAKEYSDLLFHIVPSAIFTVDTKGMITSWNKRAAELTGYSVFEAIGKHCSLFADQPCDSKCGLFSDSVAKPFNNKESFIKTKDGRIRAILKNVDYIRDPFGKIIGGIESFDDITDKKRDDDKLRQLSQAVEQSPSMAVITDTDGAIEYVNPRFTDLTGYKLHEVVGLNPRILKTGDKSYKVYKELWDTIKSGRTWHGEFRNKKKSGETYWEFAAISPIKDGSGVITGYLKVAEDITERKQIEKIKDDFVNTVSHELRTPLTAIKESIGIVYDGSAGPLSGDQKDFLETAKRNVDRLARLINEVLDFQKLQAGAMKFDKKEADINNIIEEVRQTMQPVTAKKGLELKLELSAGLPSIFVDRDKIVQVLVNLVNNAVKFTSQGSITVRSGPEGENGIKVSVIDTGTGISKEDMLKLFQSFSQVGSPDQRKTGSTGLGLAITREIVRQHGGKIEVSSELGKGSVFYFILPVMDRRFHIREV